jgi:hypothetical protein
VSEVLQVAKVVEKKRIFVLELGVPTDTAFEVLEILPTP